MKIGLSSYSLNQAIQSGEMTIIDAVQWVADQGFDHMEIVPIGFNLEENEQLIGEIKEKAEQAGIELSHYLVGGNFLTEDEESFEQAIEKYEETSRYRKCTWC